MERAAAAYHGEAMQYLVLLAHAPTENLSNAWMPPVTRHKKLSVFVVRVDMLRVMLMRTMATNRTYKTLWKQTVVSAGAILHRGIPGIIAQDQ